MGRSIRASHCSAYISWVAQGVRVVLGPRLSPALQDLQLLHLVAQAYLPDLVSQQQGLLGLVYLDLVFQQRDPRLHRRLLGQHLLQR